MVSTKFEDMVDSGCIFIKVYNIKGYNQDFINFIYECPDIDNVDEFRNIIKNNCEGKLIKINLKIKNGEIKKAKIDLDSLAEVLHDDRFKKIGLLGY